MGQYVGPGNAPYVVVRPNDEADLRAKIANFPGRAIWVPKGTYPLTVDDIIVAADTEIIGESRQGTIISCDGGDTVFKTADFLHSISNCHFQNFTIDCLGTTDYAIKGCFLSGRFKDVIIQNADESGLQILGSAATAGHTATGWIVDHCRFVRCDVAGILADVFAGDAVIGNHTICAENSTAILARCGDLLIDTTEIYSTEGHGNALDQGIWVTKGSGYRINNNYIGTFAKHGIVIDTEVDSESLANFTIVGNLFSRCSYGTDNTYDSIHLKADGAAARRIRGVIITGNTFMGMDPGNSVRYHVGTEHAAGSDDTAYCSVIANTFYHSHTGDCELVDATDAAIVQHNNSWA